MSQITCGKDGYQMIPYCVDVVEPHCEVRVGLRCPHCKNIIMDTYTYPVGSSLYIKIIHTDDKTVKDVVS
jgi:hypothetical protein